MNNLYKILCIVAMSSSLVACAGSSNTEADQPQIGRIDPDILTKHSQTRTSTEEYVNRVAKRILTVSDHIHNNYIIEVDNNDDVTLQLDAANNAITISQGLLLQLQDEAELAATLSLAMNKLSNNYELDRTTATQLYHAGYAPQALVDLQSRYHNQQLTWLNIIYNNPLNQDILHINQAMIDKMPKGLQRGSDTYNKQIRS